MHRAQIILEDWHFETLKVMARREGRSISGLVRKILDEKLESDRSLVSSIKGIGRDGSDAGLRHDELLYRR